MHQNSADCEAVLKLGLGAQTTVLKLMANENGTHKYMSTDPVVDLSKSCNVFQLLPPEGMPESINLEEEGGHAVH